MGWFWCNGTHYMKLCKWSCCGRLTTTRKKHTQSITQVVTTILLLLLSLKPLVFGIKNLHNSLGRHRPLCRLALGRLSAPCCWRPLLGHANKWACPNCGALEPQEIGFCLLGQPLSLALSRGGKFWRWLWWPVANRIILVAYESAAAAAATTTRLREGIHINGHRPVVVCRATILMPSNQNKRENKWNEREQKADPTTSQLQGWAVRAKEARRWNRRSALMANARQCNRLVWMASIMSERWLRKLVGYNERAGEQAREREN